MSYKTKPNNCIACFHEFLIYFNLHTANTLNEDNFYFILRYLDLIIKLWCIIIKLMYLTY